MLRTTITTPEEADLDVVAVGLAVAVAVLVSLNVRSVTKLAMTLQSAITGIHNLRLCSFHLLVLPSIHS